MSASKASDLALRLATGSPVQEEEERPPQRLSGKSLAAFLALTDKPSPLFLPCRGPVVQVAEVSGTHRRCGESKAPGSLVGLSTEAARSGPGRTNSLRDESVIPGFRAERDPLQPSSKPRSGVPSLLRMSSSLSPIHLYFCSLIADVRVIEIPALRMLCS